MQTKNCIRALLCGGLLTAGAASAGGRDPNDRLFNIFVKGGLGTYTGSYASYTAWGPAWGAGIGLNPVNFLTVEVAYEGSHNATIGTFFPQLSRPGILRNGVDGMLKVVAPLGWFRPFVGGGFGVSWLRATGFDTSGLKSSFVEEVPVAGGLEFLAGPILIGARFTYHFLFNNGIIQDPANPSLRGGLGDVQLLLGASF